MLGAGQDRLIIRPGGLLYEWVHFIQAYPLLFHTWYINLLSERISRGWGSNIVFIWWNVIVLLHCLGHQVNGYLQRTMGEVRQSKKYNENILSIYFHSFIEAVGASLEFHWYKEWITSKLNSFSWFLFPPRLQWNAIMKTLIKTFITNLMSSVDAYRRAGRSLTRFL